MVITESIMLKHPNIMSYNTYTGMCNTSHNYVNNLLLVLSLPPQCEQTITTGCLSPIYSHSSKVLVPPQYYL